MRIKMIRIRNTEKYKREKYFIYGDEKRKLGSKIENYFLHLMKLFTVVGKDFEFEHYTLLR